MLIGSFGFASIVKADSNLKNKSIIIISGFKFTKSSIKKSIKSNNEDPDKSIDCSVSCSITLGDVTFSASAGNFLSSCERAGRKCAEKLAGAVKQFLQTAPSTPQYQYT